MATYTVTTSNWNLASFWASIFESGGGHTLDMSGLPSTFTIDFDDMAGTLEISDGTTFFTIGDASSSAPVDATLGGSTEFEFFEFMNFGDGDDGIVTDGLSDGIDAGDGHDTINSGLGDDTIDGGAGNDYIDAGNVAGGPTDLGPGLITTTLHYSVTDTGVLRVYDPATDTETEIATGLQTYGDIAITPDGQLIGIQLSGDTINLIDAETGAETALATIDNGFHASLAANSNGDLYYTTSNTLNMIPSNGDGTYGAPVDLGSLAANTTDLIFTDDNTLFGAMGSDIIQINLDPSTGLLLGTDNLGPVVGGQVTDIWGLSVGEDNRLYAFEGSGEVHSTDLDADPFVWSLEPGTSTSGGQVYGAANSGDVQTLMANFAGVDNDSVDGGAGDDTILGGVGDDTLAGGTGQDSLDGGADDDSLQGGADDDSLQGGDGNDTLEGGTGNDVLLGGVDGGNDSLDGGDGNDTLNGEDGADTLSGGTGDDQIFAGTGDDVVVLNDNFGNDNIQGGSAGETNGDTLDMSGMTNGVTVDLTAADPEDGTVSDGTSTATFDDIENIVLGGGRDTLELADGGGADSVQSFDMTDSGDGTTMDQLDVSGLTSDGGTTPVTTDDVVVSDTNGDGTGDAILTFPGGESITLVGVTPAQVDTPAELESIGVPAPVTPPNYIVEGTGAGEVINAGYNGDPEGDKIDDLDHSDGSNDDSVQAGGGDDTIDSGLGDDTVDAGDGNDEVYAQEGDDSVMGGSGNDTILGEAGSDTLEGGTGNDSLDGGVDADSLSGGSGNDTLLGQDGDDTLGAGGNADFVNGGSGDDLIRGGGGDDTLEGWFGEDTIFGDAGNDYIDADNDADYVDGGDGDDTVVGGFSLDSDTILGGAGNDSLNGQAGDDLIYGGTGDDVQLGAEGDDTFFLEDDFGNDTIEGAEVDEVSGDTLDMSALTQGTTLDLTNADPEAGTVNNGTDTASFTEIENFILGGGADTLVLGDGGGDDTVQAFDMSDFGDGTTVDQLDVTGMTSDGGTTPVTTDDVVVTDTNGDGTGDAILTFPGGETITLVGVTPDQVDTPAELESIGIPAAAAAPNFIVEGDAGDDLIDGSYADDPEGDMIDANDHSDGSNADSVEAGAGADTVLSGAGDDTVNAGDGDDNVTAGAGNDDVDGGLGQDTLYGNAGADTLEGGADDDLLYGGDGADTLLGGTGSDYLSGGAEADSLSGGDGDDNFDGGDGNDTIIGGDGNDNADGDAGDDSMVGGLGNDSMWGDDGDDTLDGGAGDDALYAGAGSDSVDGGAGTDYIQLTEGADTVSAGDDNDSIDVIAGAYADGTIVTIDGGAGGTDNDALDLTSWEAYRNLSETTDADGNSTSGSVEVQDASGSWITVNFTEIEDLQLPSGLPNFIVEGDAGDDLINATYAGDPEGDMIDANDHSDGSNADSVVAGAGNDTVFAGAGDDSVEGGTGADELHGNDGDDLLDGGSENDSLFGGDGNDTMLGGAGDDSMEAWLGDDSMVGGDGNDYMDGAQDNDTLEGGDGNDTLLGGSADGDDSLDGGAGDDSLTSGDGEDTLVGGTGDDSMFGGGGDDLFVMEDDFGNDTIHGWTGTETDGDTLDLSAVTDDLTVDLTANNPEDGSVTDGTSTATFVEIENIILGGGDDTIVLADGAGNNAVDGFDMTDSGDGTTNDQLDVSGLTSDGGTTPVTTADVVVSDTNGDGTGDAILTFPGGESITLVGVAPAEVDTPAELESIGIPGVAPDFIVEGTSGDDTINASYLGDPEGDQIDNLDHSDGSNADSVEAGAGDDQVISGAGNDTVDAGSGNDLVFAGAGDDTVLGMEGADTINGMSGDDLIDGGADNDSLVAEDGAGNDTIIGGETGLDEDLLASFKTGDVVVDLTAGGTAADAESGTLVDGADTITFSEIEEIRLGGGDDLVTGSNGDDSVATGSGSDTVDGGAGDDSFNVGGADGAVDTVVFSDGDGQDTVGGFEVPNDNGDGTFTGFDQLDVSDLTDANGAPVNTGDVTVTDTNGDGTGDAILTFPNGESITLDGVNPAQVNDPAALEAMGIPAPDYIVSGTGGDDTIDADYLGDPEGDLVDADDAADGSDDDVIEAGAGNDSVLAGDGDDEVFGADGSDTLFGGAGNDTLDGDNGFAGGDADFISGEAGDDQIIGDVGDDTLDGGTGSDTIFAGDDDDLIEGGTGDDQMFGQSGDDTIVMDDGFGNDAIVGGEAGETDGDTLDLSGTTTGVTVDLTGADPEAGTVSDGTDTATFSEIENIVLGGGSDTVTLADGGGLDVVDAFDLTDAGDGSTVDQLDVSGLTDADGDPVNVGDVVVTDTNGDGTGDAILTFPNGESITLTGVTPDQVDSPSELNAIGIPCFTPGTMIATLLGNVAVEDLKPGDLVLTADNGFKPVQWVGSKSLSARDLEANPELKPVVLRKGAFGNERKLRVSPQHGMIIKHNGQERLIRAKHAVEAMGGQYARVDHHCEAVTYVHIMFDQHELIFAEGTKSESFFPGPQALRALDNDAARELLKLFPELAQVAAETQTTAGAYGAPVRPYLKRKEVLGPYSWAFEKSDTLI